MSRFTSFGFRSLLALTFLDLSTVSLRVSSSSFARVFPLGGLGTFALAFAHEFELLLKEHNQDCQPQDAIVVNLNYSILHNVEFFRGMVQLQRDADLVHNRVKNNVLVEKVDQLALLRESFDSAFVTTLCHSIYQAINEGKKVLTDLNKELEHHRFGADREKYWFGYEWVAEFREYWHFFDEVYKSPSLGEGPRLNKIGPIWLT